MDNNIIIDKFMYIFMYQFEKFLSKRKEELLKISFQSDEANTDRPLKEYLKKVIENNFKELPKESNIKYLKIDDLEKYDYEIFTKIKISKVLLPEDITPDIKNIIRKSNYSVYTNPDICFEIIYNGNIYYKTIELKSTKNNNIPGSSIQQIKPHEWVIFIKHSHTDIEITTGQYLNAINEKIQFPDRSPRPQVSFKQLKEWNNTFRYFDQNNQQIKYLKDNQSKEKINLITDWQSVLSERWVNMLFENDIIKKNEPWFNNTMRKFILDFLNIYELLEPQEQEKFKDKIKKQII